MKLTRNMHVTLVAACKNPLRRTHKPNEGKPPWPAHCSTIYALVRHDLLGYEELLNRHGWKVEVWTPTDAGRSALERPALHLVEQPMFLNRKSGYTASPARSIDVEHDQWGVRALEAVDAPESFIRASEVERLAAQDRREVARRLARGMRAA